MTARASADMVAEFMTAFNSPKDPALWQKLVLEEAKELVEAFQNVLKEAADLQYVMEGYVHASGGLIAADYPLDKEIAQRAAMVLEYLYYDNIPETITNEVFRRVHASNMSKLGEDGKPIFREDGKVLKGPNYKPPNFDDII